MKLTGYRFETISILHRVFGDRNGNRINSIFDLPIIVSTILIENLSCFDIPNFFLN